MSKIKKFFKNILISFLIFYIIIANTSSSYARKFDDAARAFLAEQTTQFINEHAGDSVYSLTVLPAAFIGTTFHSCCTSGVAYVYKAFLGLDIYALGFSNLSDTDMTSLRAPYWKEVSFEESKPGDILVRYGHVEMVAEAGNKTHFNFGSGTTNANLNIHPSYGGEFLKVFSLSEDVEVTPTGSLPETSNELEEEDNALEDPADEFYYQGMPQQGSFAGSSSIGLGDLVNWLFNLISQLIDFITGFMTMIIRIVIVGWANIIVNIVTEAVDAITGEAVDTSSTSSSDSTTSGGDDVNTYDDQKILDSDDLYTPSSTELQPEGDDKLTIDKIIFNQIPLLDVNVFTDTAAGYNLTDDGSLKIIRDSIATWYYALRNITIAIMLVILIYIGIKIAISSVASEKAEYKRMLVNWVVGFLIIFVIHYYLILVLNINSTILGWITNAQQSMGYEDSIYETVRTKAYEIKFSAGTVGTILYIILVILMLKFLYVYIKRFLAVCILVVMAPLMGASYAISKVRTGKAKPFNQWMKDYTMLVLIQSVHALIYTCFVTVALQLTNESLTGIVLSLIVMNFMLKATDIFTDIFGMVGDGKSGGSRSLKTILGSDIRADTAGALLIFTTNPKEFKKNFPKKVLNTKSNIIGFGHNIKDFFTAPKTTTQAKQLAQAKGLGLDTLGKGALGQSWRGIKNIDPETGQYIPGEPEKLTSLSEDLKRETKQNKKDRKAEGKEIISKLYKSQDEYLSDAFKLATGIPFMGVSGLAGLGASNIIHASSNIYKRRMKRPKGKRRKYSLPVKTARIMFAPIVAGGENVVNSFKDINKNNDKIQGTYDKRMERIDEAKLAESAIIDLYIEGRRDKEEELKEIQKSSKDTKVLQAMAKTSFDSAYQKTIESVYQVSDLVDKTMDRANDDEQVQIYKDKNGISDNTVGKQTIEDIKEQVRQKAAQNIEEKIREEYHTSTGTNASTRASVSVNTYLSNQEIDDENYKFDEDTEQKIKEETERRVSMFMQDLNSEIDKKVKVKENLASDTTVIKGNKLDFSETIDKDTLKSSIEDVMKKHKAEKKAEEGMEQLREEMQKLQRIDRDYANDKNNKQHRYLYKFGSNLDQKKKNESNLKNVLTSLTFRNIDINREGE